MDLKKSIKTFIRSYRLLYNWQIQDNIFIVSTGRTATNFFAHFFNENFENVMSVHEPNPDLFSIGMQKYRSPSSIFGTKSLIKAARYGQYKDLKSKGKNIYIESNPNLAIIIPEIVELFPSSKFLFVTRDLPSYLLSAYSKSPDGSNEMFFYSENDKRKRLQPCDIGDTKYEKLWKGMSREEKIAWYWATCNSIIYDNLSAIDHLHIKYEDIFFGEKKVKELKKVIQFFNLPENNSEEFYKNALSFKRNKNPKQLLESFNNIEEDKKNNILAMTTAMRKKLNYI